MAQDQSDIVTANPGVGGPTFAADTDPANSHIYPKSKLTFGTQHQDYYDVERNYPLPTELSNPQLLETMMAILRELRVISSLLAEGFGAAGEPDTIRSELSNNDQINILT